MCFPGVSRYHLVFSAVADRHVRFEPFIRSNCWERLVAEMYFMLLFSIWCEIKCLWYAAAERILCSAPYYRKVKSTKSDFYPVAKATFLLKKYRRHPDLKFARLLELKNVSLTSTGMKFHSLLQTKFYSINFIGVVGEAPFVFHCHLLAKTRWSSYNTSVTLIFLKRFQDRCFLWKLEELCFFEETMHFRRKCSNWMFISFNSMC